MLNIRNSRKIDVLTTGSQEGVKAARKSQRGDKPRCWYRVDSGNAALLAYWGWGWMGWF